MADLRDDAEEYEGREEHVAGDEASDDDEIYYPGMLADLHEQVTAYREEVFERELFGGCDSGEGA